MIKFVKNHKNVSLTIYGISFDSLVSGLSLWSLKRKFMKCFDHFCAQYGIYCYLAVANCCLFRFELVFISGKTGGCRPFWFICRDK